VVVWFWQIRLTYSYKIGCSYHLLHSEESLRFRIYVNVEINRYLFDAIERLIQFQTNFIKMNAFVVGSTMIVNFG